MSLGKVVINEYSVKSPRLLGLVTEYASDDFNATAAIYSTEVMPFLNKAGVWLIIFSMRLIPGLTTLLENPC
jgi:hypothetical protein